MSKSVKLLFLVVTLLLAVGLGQATANPAGLPNKGTVVETMDAGGYTYLLLDNNGQKGWTAIPSTPVKVGAQVEVASGMVMQNFTSKTLGRTFSSIVFSKGLVSR